MRQSALRLLMLIYSTACFVIHCAYENTTLYVKGFLLCYIKIPRWDFVADSWLDATWVATAVCLAERRGVKEDAYAVKMEKGSWINESCKV